MKPSVYKVAAVAAASTIALAACGSNSKTASSSSATQGTSASSAAGASASSSGSHKALKSLDWANITDAGALQISIQDSIKVASRKLGVNLKLYNNNADPTTALRNAQLMLTDHPDVVADFNSSITANKAIGNMFSKANQACVGVDIQVPNCVWLQLNNPAMGTEAGQKVGDMVKAKGWTGKDTTVIGITTWATGPFVNGCVTDFYSSFAQTVPGMVQKSASSFGPNTTRIGSNYIGLDAGLLPQPAFQAVQQVLPSIPSSQHLVIVGLNDDVVNAALKAANAAGRSTADTLAVGLGDGASINELRTNPQWVAEDDVFYKGWGETLVAVADGLVNGVKPSGPVDIPATVVTKANVNQYYGSSGDSENLLPFPSQDGYLKPLGVLQKFGNFQGLQ